MELYEDRVMNGVLKARGRNIQSIGPAASILSRDIEIVVDPARCHQDDLWPCVWALAAALGRQFRGRIFINCGRSSPLAAPGVLPRSCVFARDPAATAVRVGVGIKVAAPGIFGDARGSTISFGKTLNLDVNAGPVSGFSLAGYLGFAALARAVGIPEFRSDFATDQIDLPSDGQIGSIKGLTLVGSGNIGQASLALLWFLGAPRAQTAIHVVDKDKFEPPNLGTQVLSDDECLESDSKAAYLARKLRAVGMNTTGEQVEVHWGWRRPTHHPGPVLIAVDDFDVRRMVLEAGYDWTVEAGIGDDFTAPRITWHSMPPGKESASIFRLAPRQHSSGAVSPELESTLRNTPGECGWVTFKGVTASAPSIGLAAASWAVASLIAKPDPQTAIAGRALLWSPLIPALIEPLRTFAGRP